MAQYSDLSAQSRDVVAALLRLADSPLEPVDAARIRDETAVIRDEEPSDYTYELLGNLADDGWLFKYKDQGDDRVNQYALSGEAWETVLARGRLIVNEADIKSANQNRDARPVVQSGD